MAPPPRLQLLLASAAPVGLVLRRGPSRVVRVILWRRGRDEFEPGQWFRGRLFADRSDISPDGRHWIYFAMGGVRWAVAETRGTWTAIARVPSLSAAALWGQGDTWAGGGFFTSNLSYWLEADRNTERLRDQSGLRRDPCPPKQSRMERDGWTPQGGGVFDKPIEGGWTLRRTGCRGGYELRRAGSSTIVRPSWEWAEWDRRRLVWTESGCLRTGVTGRDGLSEIRDIHDFNAD